MSRGAAFVSQRNRSCGGMCLDWTPGAIDRRGNSPSARYAISRRIGKALPTQRSVYGCRAGRTLGRPCPLHDKSKIHDHHPVGEKRTTDRSLLMNPWSCVSTWISGANPVIAACTESPARRGYTPRSQGLGRQRPRDAMRCLSDDNCAACDRRTRGQRNQIEQFELFAMINPGRRMRIS